MLHRDLIKPTFTRGSLYIDGKFECCTIEDTDRKLESGGVKIPGKTAIPRGEYQIKITQSHRFNRLLPLLVDVPQFTGVRIHPGNTSEDTEGCILPGVIDQMRPDRVLMSRTTFDGIFKRMQFAEMRGESLEILIT